MWPSLVGRLIWDQEVAGSSPVIPIIHDNQESGVDYEDSSTKESSKG